MFSDKDVRDNTLAMLRRKKSEGLEVLLRLLEVGGHFNYCYYFLYKAFCSTKTIILQCKV